MLDRIGRYFFRTRNVIFPIMAVALVVLFPPRGFGDSVFDAVAMLGVGVALTGQAIRVITVGLDYVKRGGRKKQIYAARLVTGGIYAHTRNPMYVGNLMVVIGLLLLVGNPWAIGIGTAFFTFAYIAIVSSEERYLIANFGDEYRAYCARTPRWFPRPWHLVGTIRSYRFDWPAVIVKEYGTIFTTLFFLTAVIAWKEWTSHAFARFAPELIGAAALWIVLYGIARYLKKGRGMVSRGTTVSKGGLAERRKRIDEIDDALLDLLNRRAAEVSAIFEWKRAEHMPRVDPDRIEAILARLEHRNMGPLSDAEIRRLFTTILAYFSHEYARPGVPGAPSGDEPVALASMAGAHAAP